jgi:hypothetical protein
MSCRQSLGILQICLNNYSTMPELTSDYAPCRDLLLKRLQEPAPGRILSGQVKSGQRWSGQNRPTDVARDLDVVPFRSLFGQV